MVSGWKRRLLGEIRIIASEKWSERRMSGGVIESLDVLQLVINDGKEENEE